MKLESHCFSNEITINMEKYKIKHFYATELDPPIYVQSQLCKKDMTALLAIIQFGFFDHFEKGEHTTVNEAIKCLLNINHLMNCKIDFYKDLDCYLTVQIERSTIPNENEYMGLDLFFIWESYSGDFYSKIKRQLFYNSKHFIDFLRRNKMKKEITNE